MPERFQPKAIQAPEDHNLSKDGLAPSVKGLSGRFDILSPEQQLQLGRQMVDGRAKADKARGQLTEKGSFLTDQEKRVLEQQIAQGEQQRLGAREQLIESCIPLVKHYARGRKSAGESSFGTDDYIQEGLVGLTKAADKYDPNKGFAFTTYASTAIRGEMQRAERDKAHLIRIPRNFYDVFPAIQSATRELSMDGRDPSDEDVAKKSKVSVEDIKVTNKTIKDLGNILYYENSPISNDSASEPFPIIDRTENTEEKVEEKVLLGQIKKILVSEGEEMDDRLKKVLRLRFGNGLTQSQVADALDISQMHVSRLEKKALETMKKILDPQENE